MHELTHDAHVDKHNITSDNLHVNVINFPAYFNPGISLCKILILYTYIF